MERLSDNSTPRKVDRTPQQFAADVFAVEEARDIRHLMISGELFDVSYGGKEFRCPICHYRIWEHLYKVPCWRFGEWDRYGLHVSATPLDFDNAGVFGSGR